MSNVSYRDQQLARRTAWAVKQGLHPAAVEHAKRTLNLNEDMLKLISAYHEAWDLPSVTEAESDARRAALRVAWDNTIRYVRTNLVLREDNDAA